MSLMGTYCFYLDRQAGWHCFYGVWGGVRNYFMLQIARRNQSPSTLKLKITWCWISSIWPGGIARQPLSFWQVTMNIVLPISTVVLMYTVAH